MNEYLCLGIVLQENSRGVAQGLVRAVLVGSSGDAIVENQKNKCFDFYENELQNSAEKFRLKTEFKRKI